MTKRVGKDDSVPTCEAADSNGLKGKSMGSGAVAEQREHERIPFTVAVTVHSDHNFYTGFTRDISEGGVFVATSNLAPMGTIVEFELALGSGKGKVKVCGEVVWIRDTFEYNFVPPGMGIRFTGLDKRVAAKIQKFISRTRDSLFYDDEDDI